jgi:DNA polymerase
MKTWVIDYETRSGVPIEHGLKNYMASKSFRPVCLCAVNFLDREERYVQVKPTAHVPIHEGDTVYAFNAQFDKMVWDKFNGTKVKWIDVMALCGYYSYPQNLRDAAKVLNKKYQKLDTGTALIKKVCKPPFKFTSEDFLELIKYCMIDTLATAELLDNLPTNYLPRSEQRIWELTTAINDRGIPIDTLSIASVSSYLRDYVRKKSERLPKITNGMVEKPTQIKRIKDWMATQGYPMDSLAKDIIENFQCPNKKVMEVLSLRLLLGKTSTAKYDTMWKLQYQNRIYENLRYYGASTGRWSGMGAQFHNFPRGSVKSDAEAEELCQKFIFDPESIEDPVGEAKKLLRSMIKAPKGKKLIIMDYKSIEYCLLIWFCDCFAELADVDRGIDQYVSMASYLYQVRPEAIDKEARDIGKALVLGAGYGLGAKGFHGYCRGYGIDISLNDAEDAIGAYRSKYKKVVDTWYRMFQTVVKAIESPGHIHNYSKCSILCTKDKQWLCIKLPSERILYYNKPELDYEGTYPGIVHWGINGYTKQWSELRLIPGRIIENIIQALARDLLADAKLKFSDVILSVHDEIVREVDEDIAEKELATTKRFMSTPPEWAYGLPLGAEGFIARRYRK